MGWRKRRGSRANGQVQAAPEETARVEVPPRVLGSWGSVLLAGAMICACGAALPPSEAASSPESSPYGTPRRTADGGVASGSSDLPPLPRPSGEEGARASRVEGGGSGAPQLSVGASTFLAELQALGLDPAKLPPLGKMDGEKLRKIMKPLSKALGAKCKDCHAEDFAAPTPRKWVAERMWDEWTRTLVFDDGSPVFCDSCHRGSLQFLDRRDPKVLARWMEDNFVGHFHRKPEGPLEPGHALEAIDCATCHGEPFEGAILAKWRLKPAPKGRGATKTR